MNVQQPRRGDGARLGREDRQSVRRLRDARARRRRREPRSRRHVPAFAPADMATSVRAQPRVARERARPWRPPMADARRATRTTSSTSSSSGRAEKGHRASTKRPLRKRRQLTRGAILRAATFLERLEAGGSPMSTVYALIGARPAAARSPIATPTRWWRAFWRSSAPMDRGRIGAIARPPIGDGDIFRTALAIDA